MIGKDKDLFGEDIFGKHGPGGPAGVWQNGAVAASTNKTPTSMKLDRFKNWSGVSATGSFPQTIEPSGSVRFTHLRGGQYGSVAAVQYSGLNAVGNPCAWIVAWQAPVEDDPPCPPNRVYVICGAKSKIDAITWDQVLISLDTAPLNADFTDCATKTGVDATIHDLSPNTATLTANFKLCR